MKRHAFSTLFGTLAALAGAVAITLVPLSTATAQTAAPGSQDQEFSVVPAQSPLYKHLQVVKQAGWAGTSSSETGSARTLSRYEMALETAKAVFTVQARFAADSTWAQKADTKAVLSLRALISELSPELVRFDVAIDEVSQLLSSLNRERQHSASDSGAVRLPAIATSNSMEDEFLVLPLSQRLRVYGAISPLAREQHGAFSSAQNSRLYSAASPNIFRLQERSGLHREVASGGATVAFDLTENLRLRTSFDQRVDLTPPTLQNSLMGNTNFFGRTNSRLSSFGGGLDLEVMPGFMLSGTVARVDASDFLTDGTRFEGGIGLTGWQNRVALSAHLSHLVPEDSMALGLTAAQLNLGIEVTRQIQLKLLYQQMFGATEAAQNNRMIGGGINIRF